MIYVTGNQARDLLNGTTPGPWESEGVRRIDTIVPVLNYNVGGEAKWENRADQRLAAAAPALAETIAWLYGREPDGDGPHAHKGRPHEYDTDYVGSVTGSGVVSVYVARDHGDAEADLTPDETVDLARALLHAAEVARGKVTD